jgi:hypothetical protein
MSEPGTREAGNVAIARTACQPDARTCIPSHEIDPEMQSFALPGERERRPSDARVVPSLRRAIVEEPLVIGGLTERSDSQANREVRAPSVC